MTSPQLCGQNHSVCNTTLWLYLCNIKPLYLPCYYIEDLFFVEYPTPAKPATKNMINSQTPLNTISEELASSAASPDTTRINSPTAFIASSSSAFIPRTTPPPPPKFNRSVSYEAILSNLNEKVLIFIRRLGIGWPLSLKQIAIMQ